MTKGIFIKNTLALALLFSGVYAQENVDAIEKARQAKEAADKAAAEAASATEAAIEAAAEKAAKEAREDAKRKKEEEEARKIAEAQAAEEAELDAAAAEAAKEAKRKMAAELGIELDDETSESALDSLVADSDTTAQDADDVVAKEMLGWNVGLATSIGLIKGESFSGGLPMGGTAVITTPYGFDVGPFKYTVSFGLGGYAASYEDEDDGNTVDLNPMFYGLGGNLMVAEFVFAEGHVGMVGEGAGFRGFAGVSLEKIMKKALNLPVNLLIGSEAFYSTEIAEGGNATGWAALGVRLDYSF